MSFIDRQWLIKAPKIELHVHLEGSLSKQFWQKKNIDLYNQIHVFKKRQKKSLPIFLECMEEIHRSLKTADDYYWATLDFLDQLVVENIRYVEFTWAPGGIWEFHGVNFQEAYQAIEKAIEKKRQEIQACILIDFIRNQPVSTAEKIVLWLGTEQPRHVVGINFGGDEGKFPIEPFVDIFAEVKSYGYSITIHAGESVDTKQMMKSVETVHPTRIGHGTAISSNVCRYFLDNKIHIEACPLSNEMLGYLNDGGCHPVFKFPELHASINTDDRSFFSKTLSDEIYFLSTRNALHLSQLAQMQMNGVSAAFSFGESPFLAEIKNYWQRVIANESS